MGFKRQHFLVTIRAIFFLLFAIGGILLIYPLRLYISGMLLSCISLVMFIWVLNSMNRSVRDFRSFLQAIRYHDFSVKFPLDPLDKNLSELRNEYNLITGEFLKLRQEKEFNNQLLQAIMNHLPIGVLVLENKDKVVLYNQEAKKLIGMESLISAKQLSKGVREDVGWWEEMEPGEAELLRIKTGDHSQDVTIRLNEITILEKTYSIFSLQNIRSELDRRELESWQKLLRILTHEIINSITPVSSLSASLQELIPEAGIALDEESGKDLLAGLQAIHSRSDSLAKFVSSYRKIARIPRPEPEETDLKIVVTRVCVMLAAFAAESGIALKNKVPPGLVVFADPSQLEQALINLIKNGIEAAKGFPASEVVLEGGVNDSAEKWLQVRDTGMGIKPDHIDKIFVPFFSTKAEGSGIGLSLSRQILLLNRAGISVESEQGKGAVFKIIFASVE